VSEDSSRLREVEFIEGKVEVQSEGTRDKGDGEGETFVEVKELRATESRPRPKSKRQESNPIEGYEPNSSKDLQNFGLDDDESEGTIVHERGLSNT